MLAQLNATGGKSSVARTVCNFSVQLSASGSCKEWEDLIMWISSTTLVLLLAYNFWRTKLTMWNWIGNFPHVEGIFTPVVRIVFCLRAVWLTRMMRRVSRFGAGIVWGTVPSGFPVFWIFVPGRSLNGCGTSPNLCVQKKLVKFWQGTQDTRLCPTEFFWEFLSYPPFDLFRNLGDVILS